MIKIQEIYAFLLFILPKSGVQNSISNHGEIFRVDIIPRIDIILPTGFLDYILDDAN